MCGVWGVHESRSESSLESQLTCPSPASARATNSNDEYEPSSSSTDPPALVPSHLSCSPDIVGANDGTGVGWDVELVGLDAGSPVASSVGANDGTSVGGDVELVGLDVGSPVASSVGANDGTSVGCGVGDVGLDVGDGVGTGQEVELLPCPLPVLLTKHRA